MDMPEHWIRVGDHIEREFRFSSFADAIAFMVRVSFHCERMDHHPEWTNVYTRVRVALTTHDAGTVTAKDVALADVMNRVFEAFAVTPVSAPRP